MSMELLIYVDPLGRAWVHHATQEDLIVTVVVCGDEEDDLDLIPASNTMYIAHTQGSLYDMVAKERHRQMARDAFAEEE